MAATFAEEIEAKEIKNGRLAPVRLAHLGHPKGSLKSRSVSLTLQHD